MPRKTDSGNPKDWLLFVKADLAAVTLLAKHETAFFVCKSKLSEALEKALKADLLSRGWRLEKIHDLQKLCDRMAGYDRRQAERIQSLADDLAESYTESRYPGFDLDEPDWPLLKRWISQVKKYAGVVRKNQRLPRRT